jgi:hypothetical protein
MGKLLVNKSKMDDLIRTINEFDPLHMVNRCDNLLDFKKELEAEGYVVEDVTQKDIECYWVRVKSNVEGRKDISLGYEERRNYEFYKQFMVKKDEFDTERA